MTIYAPQWQTLETSMEKMSLILLFYKDILGAILDFFFPAHSHGKLISCFYLCQS